VVDEPGSQGARCKVLVSAYLEADAVTPFDLFLLPLLADHFGTLIICLPTPFAGGQLVLRHINHNSSSLPLSHTFDWAKQLNDPAGQQALQWAAFYNDTEHEVLPVTEGHRITLTYNLRAPQNPDGAVEPDALDFGLTDDEEPSGLPTEPPGKTQPEDNVVSSSWMTAADVSASTALTAQLKQLLADKAWHTQGETAEAARASIMMV